MALHIKDNPNFLLWPLKPLTEWPLPAPLPQPLATLSVTHYTVTSLGLKHAIT